MYALLPAFVSSLFLFYGVYVLGTRGRSRASLAFFALTVLTFLWQGLWAFLFRAPDAATAQVLAKLGWLAILPLPTTIYHFAAEMAERPYERRWLLASYALAAVLMALLPGTDWVISGVRLFDFGFYPKAGPLEAVHIAQTTALILRSLWLLYAGQRVDVNPVNMFLSIVKVVLVPIALGFVVNHFFHAFTQNAVRVLPLISTTAIVLIICAVVSANSAKIMTSGLLILAVVILHNLLGYLTGFGVGKLLKLDSTKCRAISIEVGMQNSGLATSLAAAHFAQYPLATIPGAVFSVWHNISGAVLANFFARTAEKKD